MALPAKRVRRDRASSSEGARDRSDGALTDDDLRKLVPSGLAGSLVKSKLHDKRLAIAGLGEPEDWSGDMPVLPEDIASLDHSEMSSLLGEFANALATALWQASKGYIEADAYDQIAEYLEDVALLDANESNEGKRKAQARTDERVVAARALQKQSYHDYVRFRDLARTIEVRWRTISRIGGFVGDEVEAEAAGAIKASTRGSAAGNARGTGRGEIRRTRRSK
jgi:hypothetical protein